MDSCSAAAFFNMAISLTQLDTDLDNMIADLTGVTFRFGGNVYSGNVNEESAELRPDPSGAAYIEGRLIELNYRAGIFAENSDDPPTDGDTITLIEGAVETNYNVINIRKSPCRRLHIAVLEVES